MRRFFTPLPALSAALPLFWTAPAWPARITGPDKTFDLHSFGLAFVEDAHAFIANTDLSALALWSVSAVLVFVIVYFALAFGLRRIGARLVAAGQRQDAAPIRFGQARGFAALMGHVLTRTSSAFIVMAALEAASYMAPLPAVPRRLLDSLFVIAFVLQGALWATALTSSWLESYAQRREGGRRTMSNATTIVGILIRTVLWSLALMLILDNLGFNITALVAGLGVGGIAIGLAAQNILGDLFASLAIIFDKPFEIGDFVVSGDHLGTVERIGLKTTRLRSLSGEQVVISNADLLSSRIRNYKRMAERRVVFKTGVTYGTPADVLARIPKLLREAIERQKNTRFDRSNLLELADYSITFETVYFVLSSDYNLYAGTHEAILLDIYRAFAQHNIDFAFPTRTVHVEEAKPAAPRS